VRLNQIAVRSSVRQSMKESPVDSDNSEPGAVRSSVSGSSVRFGAFEVSLDTGELRKHGVRVRLQRRPFHILQALLEKPGQVVSREELRSRLWSSDTFVDFESGLNTAINRLRTALGDSAESPIYIETLARIGYRFIAPVAAPTRRRFHRHCHRTQNQFAEKSHVVGRWCLVCRGCAGGDLLSASWAT